MNRGLAFLGALGLGAGLMYFLDPNAGKRRRGVLRDRAARAVHGVGDHLDNTAQDARQRAQGLFAEVRSRLRCDDVADDVLVDRVRSRMGHVIAHPHALEVAAHAGRIVLRGPILARELKGLLDCVAAVPGVHGVDKKLEVHAKADVPALQGGHLRRPTHWSPTARVLACAAGCVLMANCMVRRTPLAVLLGTAGFALCVRGLTDLNAGRLLGVGTENRRGAPGLPSAPRTQQASARQLRRARDEVVTSNGARSV